MKLRLFEATNGVNWGKFIVGRPDEEWDWRSGIAEVARQVTNEHFGEGSWEETADSRPHLRRRLLDELGWTLKHIWVLDLQTGEGAFFRHGGHAHNDLQKHRIYVCPLFEPFLTWLYKQDLDGLFGLPHVVELPEAPAAFYGYRRPGPGGQKTDLELAIAGVLHDLDCTEACTPTVYPAGIWDAVERIRSVVTDPTIRDS